VIAVGVAGLLGLGGVAIAQSTGTRSRPAVVTSSGHAGTSVSGPVFRLAKSNFGIAPGAGFFVNNPGLARGLNDFKTLGVHWIRSIIPWQNFEPSDPATLPAGASKWNWKAVDSFVATMQNPAYRGLFNLIVILDAPPTWATLPSHISPINCAIQAPFDLQAYADATAALAQHLAGTASVFEIENSPNIGVNSAAHDFAPGVWPIPNPCGYAQLLKLTTPEVHAANPAATVLVGGIGGNQDIPGQRMAADTFLSALYANGARGYFDAVAYHPYSTPTFPCAPSAPVCTFDPTFAPRNDPYGMSNGWDRMLNARNIMVANGDTDKKIWITEFGGPTNGNPSRSAVLTQAQQAALLTAGFDRASQYPWIAEMCWFTYQDQAGANPATSPTGDWMGLVNPDYSHKLSFATFQALAGSALPSSPTPDNLTAQPGGYWLVDQTGTVHGFGSPSYGDLHATPLASPIVAMAATANRGGYWLLGQDGGVFSFGNAPFYGSTGALHLAAPVISMTAPSFGGGYWFAASDGGVFSFGTARFHGSTGAMKLNRPIVGIAATPTGNGYWLVASDGGVFSFGDAHYYGSTGALTLNKPIVGIRATPTGNGYQFVANDGGIFTYGDAHFYGSLANATNPASIVAIS
jgi:hypothetical protein